VNFVEVYHWLWAEACAPYDFTRRMIFSEPYNEHHGKNNCYVAITQRRTVLSGKKYTVEQYHNGNLTVYRKVKFWK
jgi:hypothetical protein